MLGVSGTDENLSLQGSANAAEACPAVGQLIEGFILVCSAPLNAIAVLTNWLIIWLPKPIIYLILQEKNRTSLFILFFWYLKNTYETQFTQ